MHYSHKTKHQVLSGVLALILSLSLLLPTIPTVWADEAADPETVIESVTDQLAAAGETTTPVTESEPAAAPASFQSTDGGADVIALTENGHFLAKLPLSADTTLTEDDLASIVWSMDKDETKEYVDADQYPNQTKGGELSTWQTSKKTPLFTVESCTLAEENGTTYLCLSFSSVCYWGSDPSAPHSNGGSYLDVCGYFNLTAKLGETALGSAAVKIVPYDSFHTMQEIYEDLDNMVTYAADNTNLYVKKFSMGKSSGVIYELLDDVFFILVPEEKVEGRTYVTRHTSGGYDLNRDNSFQTTAETQNMQHLHRYLQPDPSHRVPRPDQGLPGGALRPAARAELRV